MLTTRQQRLGMKRIQPVPDVPTKSHRLALGSTICDHSPLLCTPNHFVIPIVDCVLAMQTTPMKD
jgi:hypothetical protein